MRIGLVEFWLWLWLPPSAMETTALFTFSYLNICSWIFHGFYVNALVDFQANNYLGSYALSLSLSKRRINSAISANTLKCNYCALSFNIQTNANITRANTPEQMKNKKHIYIKLIFNLNGKLFCFRNYGENFGYSVFWCIYIKRWIHPEVPPICK